MGTNRTQHRESRDWLAFDRSDRWALVVLLALIALASVWAWVVDPLLGWAGGDPLGASLSSPITVPQLDATGVGYGPGSYDVEVVDPSTGQRLLALAPGVLTTALVALACWCVLRLLRTVAAGDPFDRRNVTRLRALAGCLVVGVPFVLVVQLAVQGALLGSLDLGGLDPTFQIDLPWLALVAGMVVALLAEAFKAGSRLRDDVDGLV